MNFRENEDAVSPVIGVILMVAITVILAAVIAAFVFGMTSDMPDTTKNVAIGVKAATGNTVMITVQGGTDLPRLKYLKLTVNDDDDATDGGVYYTQADGTFGDDGVSAEPSAGKFTVGSVWKAEGVLRAEASDHVVVVGFFNDGTEQILTDTYL